MAQLGWGEYIQESEKAGAGGFALMPVGPHNVSVDTAEPKSTKGGAGILLRLVAYEGPADGQSILNNLSMYKNNGEVNGFFMGGLSALGLGVADQPEMWQQIQAMTEEQAIIYLAQACVDRKCTIVVTHKPYNGEPSDNVKKMSPLGAPILGGPLPGPGPTAGVVPAAIPAGVPVAPVTAAPTALIQPVAAPVAAAPVAAPVPVAPVAAAPVAAAPAPAPVATTPQPVPVAPDKVVDTTALQPAAAPPLAAPVAAPATPAVAVAPTPDPVPQVDPMQPPPGQPF